MVISSVNSECAHRLDPACLPACYDWIMDDPPTTPHIDARRPMPELPPAQNMALHSPLLDDAAPVQEHAGALGDPAEFTVSVDEIRARLFERGISKSKDTIQRYCREGELTCLKFGLLRRYYATETSVAALLEKLEKDAGADNSTQVHEAAHSDDATGLQVHAGVQEEKANEDNALHEDARTSMEMHAGARSDDEINFLREQIRKKDEQIENKDKQIESQNQNIGSMIERDRETNILIRELQTQLANVGALPGGRNDHYVDGQKSNGMQAVGKGDNPQTGNRHDSVE